MISLLSWVVLGLIAGALAKLIYPGEQGGGLLATTGLGILGALVGGWIGKTVLGVSSAATGLSIAGIITAVLGAIAVIFVWGLVTQQSA
ncbi:GlsB/YeaQ/YmgE family stress response membrane protein [Oxynema sp. CENA135]|uniref:GlsB/YeaQ/YmgE family stress response membrane protein n=1 Tax=Oxynema sp. CENA135 TaxID=984206 RepID=UPI00190A52F2|nr:GlsB/YeaQ/YmgE family stress response membrane protein [Oxynema sp. CENA135]MBK4730565.1 GlsB/YeaQ/YmgE family stress response membrane protein [Oxynema sp. CENA135]